MIAPFPQSSVASFSDTGIRWSVPPPIVRSLRKRESHAEVSDGSVVYRRGREGFAQGRRHEAARRGQGPRRECRRHVGDDVLRLRFDRRRRHFGYAGRNRGRRCLDRPGREWRRHDPLDDAADARGDRHGREEVHELYGPGPLSSGYPFFNRADAYMPVADAAAPARYACPAAAAEAVLFWIVAGRPDATPFMAPVDTVAGGRVVRDRIRSLPGFDEAALAAARDAETAARATAARRVASLT